jgi:hypothetical protein
MINRTAPDTAALVLANVCEAIERAGRTATVDACGRNASGFIVRQWEGVKMRAEVTLVFCNGYVLWATDASGTRSPDYRADQRHRGQLAPGQFLPNVRTRVDFDSEELESRIAGWIA